MTTELNPKIGLVGVGHWGQNLAKTLFELGALGGLAETDPAKIASLKKSFPNTLVGSIAETMAGCDAFCVATPAPTHFEVAEYLLKGGKDVFVEKPLTLDFASSKKLVALAKDRNRVLMVGHLLVYQPAIQFLKKEISDGKIGDLLSLNLKRLNLGKVRSTENALWSLGVHDVAVMMELASNEKIAHVTANGSNFIQKHISDDVRVQIVTESNKVLNLHVSWLWHTRERGLTAVGSKGFFEFDEISGKVFYHKKRVLENLSIEDGGSELVFESNAPPLKIELSHFIDCVKTRKTPITSGESALPVVELLERISKELS